MVVSVRKVIMEKKGEQNGSHFLSIGNGSTKSKDSEARASLTKSTSGLSNLKQKETIVSISGGDKGCYFSRVQVGVFVFALLLTLSAVVVLVVCFSDSNRHFHRLSPPVENVCKCGATDRVSYVTHPENTISLHTALSFRSTSEPFTISDQPEIGIRLPGDVIPVHYDIDLDVNIEHENYTGSVKILTNVYKNTNLLILHVKPYVLRVTEEEIFIYPLMKGETNDTENKNILPISKQFIDFDKEIHAVELKQPMKKGLQYIIYVRKFRGLLMADLKGMYMSSYKNKNGEKR